MSLGGVGAGTVDDVIVVSVCSLKGGVGKTSVVLGLASAALSRGVPTLVVDLDPQADATTALNVENPDANPVAAVLSNPRIKTVANALSPSAWSEGQSGLADDGLRGTDRALGRLTTALARTDGYQLVLIDCPPSFGTLTRTGLVASHRAMVVTEPALF